MNRKAYIESNTGCISNKGSFKSWLCPKEGDIRIFETKETAERTLKYNKGLVKSNLDSMEKHLAEAKINFPDMADLYEDEVLRGKKDMKWFNSCEVKEVELKFV